MTNKISYHHAEGYTLDEMREHARKTDLYNRGDMILVWINEGDMLTHNLLANLEKTLENKRLAIGTKIYHVEEDNNVLKRQRIYTTIDGVEWYRYDQPLRTQRMTERTIVGRVLKTIEGSIPDEEDHVDQYYLDDGSTLDITDINKVNDWYGYLLDKEEALDWIEKRQKETERIERS